MVPGRTYDITRVDVVSDAGCRGAGLFRV